MRSSFPMKLSDLPSDVIQNIFQIAMSSQINEINHCTDAEDMIYFCKRPRPYRGFNLSLTSSYFHNEFLKFRNNQLERFSQLYFSCHNSFNWMDDEFDQYIKLLEENVKNGSTDIRIIHTLFLDDSFLRVLKAAADNVQTALSIHSVIASQLPRSTRNYDEQGNVNDLDKIISPFKNLRRLEMLHPSPAFINDLVGLQSRILRRLVLQEVKERSIGALCTFLKEGGRHRLSEVSIDRLNPDIREDGYTPEYSYSYLFYSAKPRARKLTTHDLGQIVAQMLESSIHARIVHAGKAIYIPGKVHYPKDSNMYRRHVDISSETSWERRSIYCSPLKHFAAFDKICQRYNGTVISAYTRSALPRVSIPEQSIPSTFKNDNSKRGLVSTGDDRGTQNYEYTLPLAGGKCTLVSVLTSLKYMTRHMERNAEGLVDEEAETLHQEAVDNITEISINGTAVLSKYLPVLASRLKHTPLVCHIHSSSLKSSRCLPNLISFLEKLKNVHALKISVFSLVELLLKGALNRLFKTFSKLEVVYIDGHPLHRSRYRRNYGPTTPAECIKYSSEMIIKLAECLKNYFERTLRIVLWHDEKKIGDEHLFRLDCPETRMAISSMRKLAVENSVETSSVVSVLESLKE